MTNLLRRITRHQREHQHAVVQPLQTKDPWAWEQAIERPSLAWVLYSIRG